MSEQTGELTKALAAVSSAVGPLETDKRNEQQKYNYISADKILERVGQELPKHGLSIIPSVVDDHYETVEYKQGSTRIDARVRFIMTITHISGEKMNAPWTGYGSDYVVPDKAIYKAITSGHKYFLMKLFNIGVGNEDGEHEPGLEPGRQIANAVKTAYDKTHDLAPPMPDEKTFKRYMALGHDVYGDEWDDKRPVQVTWITNQRQPPPKKELTSSKELTLPEIKRLIAIMEDKQ